MKNSKSINLIFAFHCSLLVEFLKPRMQELFSCKYLEAVDVLNSLVSL